MINHARTDDIASRTTHAYAEEATSPHRNIQHAAKAIDSAIAIRAIAIIAITGTIIVGH